MEYAKTIYLDLPFAKAVPRVKEAFLAEGFGTLTEIDVQATMEAKLGVHMEHYVILGTCNPHLAHRAMEITRDVGLLLPCNVVVREQGDGVVVQALDATVIAAVPDLPALEPIAHDAGEHIHAALEALREGD